MLSKLTTKLLKIITQEKDQILLWIPVFLAIGIIFFFSFPHQSFPQIICAVTLLLLAILLSYYDRFSYRCFIYILSGVMLCGFLWTNFYQKTFISNRQITGKVYADVKGEVVGIKSFENSVNKKKGLNLLIADPVIYKVKFEEKKTEIIKKPSEKPKKMIKKFLKLLEKCGEDSACITEVKKASDKHEADKIKRREEKKKNKKISQKRIEDSFLNLTNYQEIDRESFNSRLAYQQVNWQQNGEDLIFLNPPKRISISLYLKTNNDATQPSKDDDEDDYSADFSEENSDEIKVSDVVYLRALMEPNKQKEFIGEFDYELYAASNQIGGYGRGIGEIKILQKAQNSSFSNFISKLREKISTKISAQILGDEAAVAQALMVGNRSLISQETLAEIRISGLAHLLAISGLHMAIAAAIFFTSIRFLLSRSEYLALNFNIKKIAATAAIFSAYFYLKLAGSPVPATRSFIMVALLLVAIMIDRKSDLKRSISLAAFILLLLNPYNIFSVSFQFSFAAILSLACFHDFISAFKPESVSKSLLKKFLWYFAEISFASIVVQIATAPFLVYHFKNFSSYGLFSNILAIPLTSFVTMPLGFLSILLMPLGLEKFPLQLMGISISWILQIAHFISSLNYSYFITPRMSQLAFISAIVSWLLICLVKSKIKWCLAVVFVASFISLFFVKKPNLLFDGQQKFFALYDEKDGLVFSKKLSKSKKIDIWMKEMEEKEFKYFAGFSQKWREEKGLECDEKKCEISTSNQKILVLLKRNKLSEICSKNFNIVVNLTAKYELPKCFSESVIKIDNQDFQKKGGYFFYFDDEEIKIKTARANGS
jgi:ComEC/Rec2-related protein